MTPFSTQAEVVADSDDINGGDVLIRIRIMLSTDPLPVREFRPLCHFDLDEAHATELLGMLSLALHELRVARKREAAQ